MPETCTHFDLRARRLLNSPNRHATAHWHEHPTTL